MWSKLCRGTWIFIKELIYLELIFRYNDPSKFALKIGDYCHIKTIDNYYMRGYILNFTNDHINLRTPTLLGPTLESPITHPKHIHVLRENILEISKNPMQLTFLPSTEPSSSHEPTFHTSSMYLIINEDDEPFIGVFIGSQSDMNYFSNVSFLNTDFEHTSSGNEYGIQNHEIRFVLNLSNHLLSIPTGGF